MFSGDGEGSGQKALFTRRVLLIGGMQAATLGLIGAQLYRLQVLDGPRYRPLAERNRIATHPLLPMRGRILDRYGTELAVNQRSLQAVLIPALAKDLVPIVDRLGQLLGLDGEQRRKILAQARSQPGNVGVAVASDLSYDAFARINLELPHLPGVRPEAVGLRRYHHGWITGHVVGHVGAIDEIGLGDEPVVRDPRMRIGRTGVEHGMDELLRGRGGADRFEVDAQGRIVRNLEHVPAKAGRDVHLTIDLELQRRVMERLSRERIAAAAVMDIETGDVLALGSHPAYDPNHLVEDFDPKHWAKLANAPGDPLVNRAIRGLYPPGSTFKMVTVLAALEKGIITPRRTLSCPGSYSFAGVTFNCWKRAGHGAVSLKRALKESCDVYHYKLARRLGIDAIAQMARRLGLGQVYPIGLSGQKAGIIPDAKWKHGHMQRPWYAGETVLASIGQGYVLSNPLQLAVMTARLASGREVVPRIVRPETSTAPAVFKPLDVAPRHLEAIQRALLAVVNEAGGTGHAASIGGEATLIAGKTGTSQVTRASSRVGNHALPWALRDHALFVAYLPYIAPRYAISVVVEHGGSGGKSAGPVVRDIASALMVLKPGERLAYPEAQRSSQTRSAG